MQLSVNLCLSITGSVQIDHICSSFLQLKASFWHIHINITLFNFFQILQRVYVLKMCLEVLSKLNKV